MVHRRFQTTTIALMVLGAAAGLCMALMSPGRADAAACDPATGPTATATAISATAIRIEWCDFHADVAQVLGHHKKVESDVPLGATQDLRPNSVTYNGLMPSHTYTFRVWACFEFLGEKCPISTPAIQVTTLPEPVVATPTDLRVCTSTPQQAQSLLRPCAQVIGQVTMVWTDRATNEEEYELEWGSYSGGPPPSWTRITLPANTTRHDIGGLSPSGTGSVLTRGQAYQMRVRACAVDRLSGQPVSVGKRFCSAYSPVFYYRVP